MATYVGKTGKVLARVRKGGVTQSKTFKSKTAARAWAEAVEREIDKAGYTGNVDERSFTAADMIDKYKAKTAPLKPRGRPKEFSLDLIWDRPGKVSLRNLTAQKVLEFADKRTAEGAGPVTVAADMSYPGGMLLIVRAVWRWDMALLHKSG